jgi:riboflavin kinase / FMN adenylyltransferase
VIQVFHSPNAARAALSHCVLTIGKYDGMHLGHQKILSALQQEAQRLNQPALVLLSEPQPEEYFAGAAAPARLNHFADKVQFLEQFGIDAVYCLNFDEAVSKQQPAQFVQELLCTGLGMQSIVVGDDFRFGHKRSGNIDTLRELGAVHNFQVTAVAPCIAAEERISSTLIRQYLQEGNLQRVSEFLGRPYVISGQVCRGQQLGRQLGFPTANLALTSNKLPMTGIFVVEVTHQHERYAGVASLGYNPTVSNDKQVKLEVYLFNFSGDLYGQMLGVNFLHKLRDELKFDSLDALCQQITLDVEIAQRFLRSRKH